MNKHATWNIPYTPKPLPRDEIYTFKIHGMNQNTLIADVELFQGGVSILRKEMGKNEYRKLENQVYQSQKLY